MFCLLYSRDFDFEPTLSVSWQTRTDSSHGYLALQITVAISIFMAKTFAGQIVNISFLALIAAVELSRRNQPRERKYARQIDLPAL